MSLLGSSPPSGSAVAESTNFGNSRSSLFDDDPPIAKSSSSALFADDDDDGRASPWDLPTPRKQQSRAELVRNLLPASEVPEGYIEVFDTVVRDDGTGGRVTSGGVARTLAAARLSADEQARIMSILSPSGDGGDITLNRSEFNVLLALIGLAQEGEASTLDGVDERRRSEQKPFISISALPSVEGYPIAAALSYLPTPVALHFPLKVELGWVPCLLAHQS